MPLNCLLYIPDSGSTQGEFLMHCSYLICIAIHRLIIQQWAMLANSLSCLGLLLFSQSEVRLTPQMFCIVLLQCS